MGYDRHVRQFYPLLKRAAARGLPINREEQWKLHLELSKFQAEIDARIQKIHPDELKKLSPERGFVNGPKEGPKIRLVPATAKYLPYQFDEDNNLKPGEMPVRASVEYFEWLDEAEDITDADKKETAEDGEVLPVISGTWRPMVQREFIEPEVKETINCGCLHDPATCENDCCLNKPTKKGTRSRKRGLAAFDGLRPSPSCDKCAGKGTVVEIRRDVRQTRWARLLPFRPSKQQIIKYIEFRAKTNKKHKVPKYKGKTTTAAKYILALAKKTDDPLYQSLLDIRTVSKADSTYIVGKGWMDTAEDGTLLPTAQQSERIHTQFTLGPATGQTSSVRPNIQNQPHYIKNENLKHLDLPTKVRALIQARPDHRIWEFDLKSAHALTLGLEARDASYMRLSRMDAHSYFGSILATRMGLWPRPIELSLSDADLKMALKEFKNYIHPSGINFATEIRQGKAKPTILGIGFGMMGKKLKDTNEDAFKDADEAQDTIDLFFEIFPLLKKYQDAAMAEAHDKHFLISKGGFIRWAWHVWHFVYDRFDQDQFVREHGDDAENVKAFRPANDAFVYMRDAESRLEEAGINEMAGFINTIHDSNVFEIPDLGTIFVDKSALSTPFGPWIPVDGRRPIATAVLGPSSKAEDIAVIIKREMERLNPLLADPIVAPDGLWIECEVKCGRNFGEFNKDRNPLGMAEVKM